MSWGLPGQVYFDNSFNFSNGTTGEKLFVVLCDSPNDSNNSIVVLTTSKQKDPWVIGQDSYHKTFGCYSDVHTPNFFLPKSNECFDVDTWLIFDEVYEYNQNVLKRWGEKFTLDIKTTIAVVHCAQLSPFVEINVTDKLKQTEDYLK